MKDFELKKQQQTKQANKKPYSYQNFDSIMREKIDFLYINWKKLYFTYILLTY